MWIDKEGKDLRKRIDKARLYVLLTTDLCRQPVLDTARLAVRGGADVLQLRGKGISDEEFSRLALELRELTWRLDTTFIVNDRPDIATRAYADGLHIGQDDMPIEEARRLIGKGRLIGVSTHSVKQARQAQSQGADYLGVGPIFATDTKARAKPVGTTLIEQVTKEIDMPVFAIGGINRDNIGRVLDAGATRVAVCSAVISEEDVLAAARGLSYGLNK
ncbi:MAG: thiamine phosphate synthase [Planctomycetes bacterium]|nr:thiamine phosphate synthase [Planctomycetota bacterium]